MPTTRLSELVPVLQTAVGPVILISGVGLLLLSLTNRFGRAVDRTRQLLREMRGITGVDRQRFAGVLSFFRDDQCERYQQDRYLCVGVSLNRGANEGGPRESL